MKFVIKDRRSEDRNASTRRDITGMVTEAPPRSWDPHTRSEYDQRKTHDSREVVIDLEPEDYTGDHAIPVPRIMQGRSVGKHGGEFFVKRIVVRHTRSYSNGEESKDNWGRFGAIYVSGPNRRADGTEGAKDNGLKFPYFHDVDGPENWTLEEIETTSIRYADGSIPPYRLDMIGTPKQVRVTDPLPDWLAAIVVRVHPRTGLAFAYGDEHRFGDFGPQMELQLATV
jgi:hypothetical protein